MNSVSFTKEQEEGQAIIMMRSDRIPSSRFLTISGWNGWDLDDTYTMGLMSRFHELDAEGNRLNKIMFIGDDDWNQPGGIAPMHWRAVTFQPRDDTLRLNLYAIRLIASAGTVRAARYQLRQDSLADEIFRGKHIRRLNTGDVNAWHMLEPGLVESTDNAIVVRPFPLTSTYLVSPTYMLPRVERIGFSVTMGVNVPERYNDRDPSHKAWMSTYLELIDYRGRVVDTIKVSACRPRFGDVLAAAGEIHPWAKKWRIRLVASHQTYLPRKDKKNMDGEMICRWRAIEVFECTYPQDYRARLNEQPLTPGEIPTTSLLQIRVTFLADKTTPSPELKSITCRLRK